MEIQAQGRALTKEESEQLANAPVTGRFDGMNNDLINKDSLASLRDLERHEHNDDTIYTLQKFCEDDTAKLDDIRVAYLYKNAAKRAARLANFNEDGLKLTINYNPDEAVSVSYAANNAIRPLVRVGTEDLLQVVIGKINNSIQYASEYTLIRDRLPINLDLYRQHSVALRFIFGATESIDIAGIVTPSKQQLTSAYSHILRNTVDNGRVDTDAYIDPTPIYITATHLGTNPVTHEFIGTTSNEVDDSLIRINGRIVTSIKDKHQEFWNQFGSTRLNFVGHVHKKSSGRDPNGHLSPDPKVTRKYEHPTPIEILPNVRYTATTRRAKYRIFGQKEVKKDITVVSRTLDCDLCGCNYKIKDLMRGEILCPQCGIVFGRATEV
jgi:hypothetical protein